jgi:hypothetical protein
MKKFLKVFVLSVFTLFAIYTNGCSDDTVTPPASQHNFEMSHISTSDTVDNAGILILDTVKVLIKDIKLKIASSSDTTDFNPGPYVLYLNFNTGVNFIGSGYIPVGTYDKVQFDIHKLGSTEPAPDPEFRDPQGNTFAVVAKGTYNGIPFIFKTDKGAKQKLNFPNALIVTTTRTNITLQIRPYLWFIDNSNQYMDPADPNKRGEIESNLVSNIKASFKAFKDDNKDGIPD